MSFLLSYSLLILLFMHSLVPMMCQTLVKFGIGVAKDTVFVFQKLTA